VRDFVEGKSALATDRSLPGGKCTLDVDTLHLESLFVDGRIPISDEASLTLRPGWQQRQFSEFGTGDISASIFAGDNMDFLSMQLQFTF